MAFAFGTFKEFLNTRNGNHILTLYMRFQDVDGSAFSNRSLGVFTWGKDSVDISDSGMANLTGTGARWAAFLYLAYVKLCRRKGIEPGPFTDEWTADAPDEE